MTFWLFFDLHALFAWVSCPWSFCSWFNHWGLGPLRDVFFFQLLRPLARESGHAYPRPKLSALLVLIPGTAPSPHSPLVPPQFYFGFKSTYSDALPEMSESEADKCHLKDTWKLSLDGVIYSSKYTMVFLYGPESSTFMAIHQVGEWREGKN